MRSPSSCGFYWRKEFNDSFFLAGRVRRVRRSEARPTFGQCRGAEPTTGGKNVGAGGELENNLAAAAAVSLRAGAIRKQIKRDTRAPRAGIMRAADLAISAQVAPRPSAAQEEQLRNNAREQPSQRLPPSPRRSHAAGVRTRCGRSSFTAKLDEDGESQETAARPPPSWRRVASRPARGDNFSRAYLNLTRLNIIIGPQ